MFGNVAVSVIAFLIALGLLISIHEYGHFWVARKVGIKVLRYSIGFGKALWKRTGKVDGTEYVLAAIPLGGYVKMLDEREGDVAPAERGRAFNQQPLWARSAVVAAGPAANFLLAILAYWLVMMIGIRGVAPMIGDPSIGSAAADAGFEREDRIVAVAGEPTRTWTEARVALLDAALDPGQAIDIDVQTATGTPMQRVLRLPAESILKSDGDLVANLGLLPWWPEVQPVVGDVLEGGPAALAGLRAGDRIVAIDGAPITLWGDLVQAIQSRPDVVTELLIERDGLSQRVQLTPEVLEIDGRRVGRIGISENQSAGMFDKARVTVQYAPVEGFFKALERTVDMSLLTVRMLGKLVVGEASLDNISGPISIAQIAGQSATIGIDHYINFIALISISLAVLNLLPVPMLDGGHLLYFAVEALIRRPVPEWVQLIGQRVGILLLAGLMFLAFYNDIGRLLQ